MSHTCHQCGQPIREDGPVAGICAPCLWRMKDDKTVLIDSPVSSGLPEVAGHIILGEIARGGMGIVFKARQLDPEREVALKMLMPLDERREDLLQRFRVEVHALAELDHPGILPLYQVGTAAGRPWFTMKLAGGGTLASRFNLRRKRFDPREAAQLMAGMADAAHHAHSHGFLHRDIKPANILFDERGDAFLADFGLAKLLDSTGHVTRSQAVLGTPCYMAPEVASKGARAATMASDIYGLGAVLYELLSGRPPFMVEGMAALVKKIVEDEPERPSTLAANVPRDLELVCLTCLAKDPRQRYATAKDAAEDLRRWLNGEPVAARRAGTAARLWSWARRRPAVASLGAALILAVLGGGTWLIISDIQLRRAIAAEKEARQRANAQSDFLIGEFADSLEKIGRLELVQSACEQAARDDAPADEAGWLRRVRLLNRLSSVTWAQGKGSEADGQCSNALAALTALPSSPENIALSVQLRCRLAAIRADTTSFDQALAQLQQAEGQVANPGILPLEAALRLRAEINITRAALWSRRQYGGTEATDAAARAVSDLRAWNPSGNDPRSRALVLAEALREEGVAWYRSGGETPDKEDLEKAFASFKEGAGLLRNQSAREPAEDFELARCAGWAGDCLLRLKDQGPAAARPWHEEEFRIVSELATQDPLNGHWQHKLAASHVSLAELAERETELLDGIAEKAAERKAAAEEAAEHRRQCLAIFEKLHQRAPAVRAWTLSYVQERRHEGRTLLKAGDKDGARKAFAAALKWSDPLVLAQPASRTEQDGWYEMHRRIGEAWRTADEPAEAEAVFSAALRFATTQAVTPGEGAAWWQWTLAALHRRFAGVQSRTGHPRAALDSNLAALKLRGALLRDRHPRALDDPAAVANSYQQTARLQLEMHQWNDALATAADAVHLFEECRDVAGAPYPWAAPVKETVDALLKQSHARVEDPARTASAHALAARAAGVFYPPDKRISLPEKERKFAEELAALGSAPPLPP